MNEDVFAAEDSALVTYAAPGCDVPVASAKDPNPPHRDSKRPFFEGWYTRVTEPTTGKNFAIILEYHRNNANLSGAEKTGGFIKVLDERSKAAYFKLFALSEAQIANIQAKDTLDVTLGNVRLTPTSISGAFTAEKWAFDEESNRVQVVNDRVLISIDISMTECWYWGDPSDPKDRSTMGGLVDGLVDPVKPPLKWHVHAMRSDASGTLTIGGATQTYTNAFAHMEKNWGDQFPVHWLWMEATDLKTAGDPEYAAFSASGGPTGLWIPPRRGYMVGLKYKGEFYSFRTQDNIDPAYPFRTRFRNVRYREGSWGLEADRIYDFGIPFSSAYEYKLAASVFGNKRDRIYTHGPLATGPAIASIQNLSAGLVVNLQRRLVRFNAAGARSAAGPWELVGDFQSDAAAVEAGGTYVAALDDKFKITPNTPTRLDVLDNDFAYPALVDARNYTLAITDAGGLALTVDKDYTITVGGVDGGEHIFKYTLEDPRGAVSDEAKVVIDAGCATGKVKNPTTGQCEPDCPPETPRYNEATDTCQACPPTAPWNSTTSTCEADCSGTVSESGNDGGPFFFTVNLGSSNGSFSITGFNGNRVDDIVSVIYEGQTLYTTGCRVGNWSSGSVPYSGVSTTAVVRIDTNCAGERGTYWRFTVTCGG